MKENLLKIGNCWLWCSFISTPILRLLFIVRKWGSQTKRNIKAHLCRKCQHNRANNKLKRLLPFAYWQQLQLPAPISAKLLVWYEKTVIPFTAVWISWHHSEESVHKCVSPTKDLWCLEIHTAAKGIITFSYNTCEPKSEVAGVTVSWQRVGVDAPIKIIDCSWVLGILFYSKLNLYKYVLFTKLVLE